MCLLVCLSGWFNWEGLWMCSCVHMCPAHREQFKCAVAILKLACVGIVKSRHSSQTIYTPAQQSWRGVYWIHYTPTQRSWREVYWIHLVRQSVGPSVWRLHGFQSISQVCFRISISNFMCMLMVAIGRSLLIPYLCIWVGSYWFSVTSLSKWPPGGHIGFFVDSVGGMVSRA